MLKRRTEKMVSIARNPNPIVIDVPRIPNNNEFSDDILFNKEFLILSDDFQSIIEDHSMQNAPVKGNFTLKCNNKILIKLNYGLNT